MKREIRTREKIVNNRQIKVTPKRRIDNSRTTEKNFVEHHIKKRSCKTMRKKIREKVKRTNQSRQIKEKTGQLLNYKSKRSQQWEERHSCTRLSCSSSSFSCLFQFCALLLLFFFPSSSFLGSLLIALRLCSISLTVSLRRFSSLLPHFSSLL